MQCVYVGSELTTRSARAKEMCGVGDEPMTRSVRTESLLCGCNEGWCAVWLMAACAACYAWWAVAESPCVVSRVVYLTRACTVATDRCCPSRALAAAVTDAGCGGAWLPLLETMQHDE